MPRRREWRVPFAVPVRVSGTSAAGHTFTATAYTLDISRTGVRLSQADFLEKTGDRITLQYQGRRARFRVAWIGVPDTPDQGQAGLILLDGEPHLWGVDPGKGDPDRYAEPRALRKPSDEPPAGSSISVPVADSTATPPAPTPAPTPGVVSVSAAAAAPAVARVKVSPGTKIESPAVMAEPEAAVQAAAVPSRTTDAALPENVQEDRRSAPRFDCDRAALCWREGSAVPLWCKLRDVSAAGCYLETRLPLEVGVPLTVQLLLYGVTVRGLAEVRTTDPGRGMGLRFTAMRPGDMHKLDAVLNRLASPDGEIARNINPRDLILRRIEACFQRQENMTREEFQRIVLNSRNGD